MALEGGFFGRLQVTRFLAHHQARASDNTRSSGLPSYADCRGAGRLGAHAGQFVDQVFSSEVAGISNLPDSKSA